MDEYDALAARGDVVAVSFDNRKGIFGHLYLAEIGGEEYAESGNAAILDYVLALQWIQDNIAVFGGDPDRVLIWGCSGSGASALAFPRTRACTTWCRRVSPSGGWIICCAKNGPPCRPRSRPRSPSSARRAIARVT